MVDEDMERRSVNNAHLRMPGSGDGPSLSDIPRPLSQAVSRFSSTVENMIIQIGAVNERIRSAEQKIEGERKKWGLRRKKAKKEEGKKKQ